MFQPMATRIRTFETSIVEIVPETSDTVTLMLDLGAHGGYRAGQYVSIDPHQFAGLQGFVQFLEGLKGRREPPRAYSMSSAPHEPLVAITIKEELYEAGVTPYPPLLSGLLVHRLKTGDPLVVTGFAGAYTLPEDVEERCEHVLHVVAGSGSVPNLSMVKDSLHRHASLRHTFVYSNKTWEDIIFRDQLTQLQRDHSARLRVVHRLTRENEAGLSKRRIPADLDVGIGRVPADLLASVLAAEPSSQVYLCGPAVSVWERRACAAKGTTPPPRFLESMVGALEGLGVPHDRIKLEAFG